MNYNVVLVRMGPKPYLFSCPIGRSIKKGDDVICETIHGNSVGTCAADSRIVSEDILNLLVTACGARLPLNPVIGCRFTVMWGKGESFEC